jgi:hypothetical protein
MQLPQQKFINYWKEENILTKSDYELEVTLETLKTPLAGSVVINGTKVPNFIKVRSFTYRILMIQTELTLNLHLISGMGVQSRSRQKV